MKNVISIIIGIFLGVVVSSILIYEDSISFNYTETTYADDKVTEQLQKEHSLEWKSDEHWHKAVSDAEQSWADWEERFKADSSWNSVYGKIKTAVPLDLYYFVIGKIEYQPGSKALEIIAQNYGLDMKSAEAAVNGSISALMKSKKVNTARSYDDASKLLIEIKKDYEEYKELFDMQSYIDLEVGPREVFSNGNSADSGFDLVKDLTEIEKILFKDTTETFVGGDWDLSLPSPYVESPGDVKTAVLLNDDIPQEGPSPSQPSSQFAQIQSPLTLSEDKKTAKFMIGDQEVAAEVMDEDICPTPDPLKAAAQKFDKENKPKPRPGVLGPGGIGAADNGDGPGAAPGGNQAGGSGGNQGDDQGGSGGDDGIQPAPGEDYKEPFCPNAQPDSNDMASDDAVTSLLGGAKTIGASYGASLLNGGINFKVNVCITLELIWKTVASYNPSDSCVLCEIEKMNEVFTKFLAHGLSPSKTTGNIFESPTCKKSLISIDQIDMKFLAISNPIPLPRTDDVMFGGNAGDEWNKYIQKQSGWWQESSRTTNTEQTLEYSTTYAEPNAPYDQLVTDLQMEVAKNTSSISESLESTKLSDQAAQVGLVASSILKEVQQMKEFFIRYKEIFQNDVYKKGCQEAAKKDSCS